MSNVCDNQQVFNKAVRDAVKHINDEDDNNSNSTAKMLMVLIGLSFYLWALFLALKVADKEHRVLHVTLALLTGPLYVLSYYLGMMSNPESEMDF
jgi:hypothetical protein